MLTSYFFGCFSRRSGNRSPNTPSSHAIMYTQPQFYPQPCYYYGYPTYQQPYFPQPMPVHPQVISEVEQLKKDVLEYVEQATQVESGQAVDACTETVKQITTSTSIQTVKTTMVHRATQSEDDGRKQLIRQLENVVTVKKEQVKQLEVTFKKKKDVLESTNKSVLKANKALRKALEEERMKFDGIFEQVMALKEEKKEWDKKRSTFRDQLNRMVDKWKSQKESNDKLISNNHIISKNFLKLQQECKDLQQKVITQKHWTKYLEEKETAFQLIRCFAPRTYLHTRDFVERMADAPNVMDDTDDDIFRANMLDLFHTETRKQLDTMCLLMDVEWMDWYAASPNREEWLHHMVCPLLLLPEWP